MKNKSRIICIAVSAAIFLATFIADKVASPAWYIVFPFYFAAYAVVGWEVIFEAGRNLVKGRLLDENFLMTAATVGAFALVEFPEAVCVMLLYQIGELFQSYAVNKSRRSIAALMDIRPEFAWLLVNGEKTKVDPFDVKVGDTIVIGAGEKVPLDGVVLSGSSALDTSALTGESLPREISAGSEILSGCINTSGTLTAEVTKEYSDSSVSKILELVENASDKKTQPEQFITKFSRIYTPVVVGLALLLALLPPLCLGATKALFAEWVNRGLIFLVVSCPCALVISVPMSYFCGLGKASKNGILIKGSNYLEILTKVKTVVFDKTGTLTKGEFSIKSIAPNGISDEELLRYAACAEASSTHPLARVIVKANKLSLPDDFVQSINEEAGYGVTAVTSDGTLCVGNARLMERAGVSFEKANGTVIYVALGDKYLGCITLSDTLKESTAKAIHTLSEQGKRSVMLTGDGKTAAKAIADELSLDDFKAELLPSDKVNAFEKILSEKQKNTAVAYVGDGINDAPTLARSDVGIAMGGLGSDAAIEASDIVIMTDELTKLNTAVTVAKKTHRIVLENILFALAVKAVVLVLGALGIANMWLAIFADVGVAMLAITSSSSSMLLPATAAASVTENTPLTF